MLTRKCEKRRRFRQKNRNDNHRCAVKPEIVGKRREVGKDPLVPLQKIYEFKADGMNIFPSTPIVRMLPLWSDVAICQLLININCSSQKTESDRLMPKSHSEGFPFRSPPCDVLGNFRGSDGVLILRPLMRGCERSIRTPGNLPV